MTKVKWQVNKVASNQVANDQVASDQVASNQVANDQVASDQGDHGLPSDKYPSVHPSEVAYYKYKRLRHFM